MTGSGLAIVRAALRSQGGGNGLTKAQVRAQCEAVERYCATVDGDEATVRDSYHGLGDQAVHPDACRLFHPRQFADRARWNAACAPFHRVPEPFDERAVLDRTPAWTLLTRERNMLPTAMLYYPGGAPVSALADSKGNAAGDTLEDAIVRGFLKLVERDTVALWRCNRTRQPAVDLGSFCGPWTSSLSGEYAGLDRQLWVLDVMSDLGVPVMAAADCYGYRPSREPDLRQLDGLARRAGSDILVLDQTRPDSGVPVVKVVVPGLRHFWPRFAPGRLYDVPVQLGRLVEPTAGEDLNPILCTCYGVVRRIHNEQPA